MSTGEYTSRKNHSLHSINKYSKEEYPVKNKKVLIIYNGNIDAKDPKRFIDFLHIRKTTPKELHVYCKTNHSIALTYFLTLFDERLYLKSPDQLSFNHNTPEVRRVTTNKDWENIKMLLDPKSKNVPQQYLSCTIYISPLLKQSSSSSLRKEIKSLKETVAVIKNYNEQSLFELQKSNINMNKILEHFQEQLTLQRQQYEKELERLYSYSFRIDPQGRMFRNSDNVELQVRYNRLSELS